MMGLEFMSVSAHRRVVLPDPLIERSRTRVCRPFSCISCCKKSAFVRFTMSPCQRVPHVSRPAAHVRYSAVYAPHAARRVGCERRCDGERERIAGTSVSSPTQSPRLQARAVASHSDEPHTVAAVA